MHTQCRVYVLKKAFPDKTPLCAPVLSAFFPGCSVYADFASGLINHLFQGSGGQQGSRPEQIMSAAMAQACQRVVFRKERQHRPGFSGLIHAGKSGRMPRHAHLNLKAFFPQQCFAEQSAGKIFMIAGFRLSMDLQGNLPVLRIPAVRILQDRISVAHHVPPWFPCRRTKSVRLNVLLASRFPRPCRKKVNSSRIMTHAFTISGWFWFCP